MSYINSPFIILLIESDEEVASSIASVTAHTFPEAIIYRTSTISESIRHLEDRTVTPRLILAASYKRHNTPLGHELEAFTGHPLALGRPVLLLEHSGNTNEVSQYYQQGIAAYHTKPETDGDWKTLLTAIRSFWFVQARLLPQ